MIRLLRFVAGSIAIVLLWYPVALGQKFDPGCKLPFADIEGTDDDGGPLPIDNKCGSEGDPNAAEARQTQNRAKNNFCAPAPATRVTFATFAKLQKAADDKDVKIPEDRTVLHDLVKTSAGDRIGEGTQVMLAAFIVKAHPSNVSKGESVNCKKRGKSNNDIHVVLGQQRKVADDCNTIGAEVSPHHRPPAWESLTDIERPVRITGQLFFDGSHSPCRPGKRASPARSSVWEIHPIYGIDVCVKSALASCDVARKDDWVPLHEWEGLEEEHPGE